MTLGEAASQWHAEIGVIDVILVPQEDGLLNPMDSRVREILLRLEQLLA